MAHRKEALWIFTDYERYYVYRQWLASSETSLEEATSVSSIEGRNTIEDLLEIVFKLFCSKSAMTRTATGSTDLVEPYQVSASATKYYLHIGSRATIPS